MGARALCPSLMSAILSQGHHFFLLWRSAGNERREDLRRMQIPAGEEAADFYFARASHEGDCQRCELGANIGCFEVKAAGAYFTFAPAPTTRIFRAIKPSPWTSTTSLSPVLASASLELDQ